MRNRRSFAGAAVLGLILLGAAAASSSSASADTTLVRGWNNVPYLGQNQPPSEALAPLSGKFNAAYRWDPHRNAFDVYIPGAPAFANTLTQLRTGDSIWLDVSGDNAALPQQATAGTSSGSGAGRVSVPAASFVPASDLAIYQKTFNELSPAGPDDTSQRYYAPVHLPDGANIASLTVHYDAPSGTQVQTRLDFTTLANGADVSQIYKLAEVLSSAGASPRTVSAFAHIVDNGANVYFLVVDLIGGSGAKLRGVSIAYTGS
jgi:hypothetical protein